MSSLYDELAAPSYKSYHYGTEAQRKIDKAKREAENSGRLLPVIEH